MYFKESNVFIFFPSYTCSSLFSHLVSKPRITYMIECQIVFKKFSLDFFLQEAQCIHCILSHAGKNVWTLVIWFSCSITRTLVWSLVIWFSGSYSITRTLWQSFNRITFLLLCSLHWWKYSSMSLTVISSGSSCLLWHDLRYAQICQHSFLELFLLQKAK